MMSLNDVPGSIRLGLARDGARPGETQDQLVGQVRRDVERRQEPSYDRLVVRVPITPFRSIGPSIRWSV